MKKKKKVNSIIYSLLTFLLIIAAVGGVIYATSLSDNFNNFVNDLETYKEFSVGFNDTVIKAPLTGQILPFNEELRFNVYYDYHKLCREKRYDYTVKVLPIGNFDFTVDGNTFAWSQEEDITDYFTVKKFDNYFTMVIPGNVYDVLSLIYPSSEIVVSELDQALDYYKLEVTSHDGKSILSISFVQYTNLTGVILNVDNLEF